MARTADQIAPEVFGTLVYNLLAQISLLRAEIERLQEELVEKEAKASPEGVE